MKSGERWSSSKIEELHRRKRIKPRKGKEIKTMIREEMLTRMIRLYGFEHEAVIQFGWLMARPQISDETLETIVKCHEEHPLWEDEDEDE